MLSHALWRAVFGAEPNAVGRQLYGGMLRAWLTHEGSSSRHHTRIGSNCDSRSVRPMSGLASFPPTCVGLPTYRSRQAILRSTFARSECQDRPASRHWARASGRSRRAAAIGRSGASTERSSSTRLQVERRFCGTSEPNRYRLREWPPAAAALSSEHGRECYSAVHARRPALLDRGATRSTSGANVDQRGAQLASDREPVKAPAFTIGREWLPTETTAAM